MADLTGGLSILVERLKKDKKALFTVMFGLLGMLLILLSELPFFSSSEKKETHNESAGICENLEQEVEKLISKINGAGKVSVMLTYESDGERVFAKDTETKTQQNDNSQSNEKYIIVDSSQGETGLLVKVIYPRVRGVAVVCSGGADPTVRSEISAVLSALFDIGSNRISIASMAEQE